MTWTYSSPASGSRDKVRWLVGDTDSAAPLVTDEEIAYEVGASLSIYSAAAAVARAIAAKFARAVQTSVSSLSFSNQQKYEHYVKLAEELEARAGTQTAPVVGSYVTENSPIFDVGMHDNPTDEENELR